MEEQENSHLIYQKLEPGFIRLLDLLPGSTTDEVQVQIRVVPIHNPGPYRSLSYAWGGVTSNVRRITCNDYALFVTQNLFDALIRFRDRSESVVWWIDAICINQASDSDREQQVKLMTQIYQTAQQGYIWLGDDNKEVDTEFAFRVANTRWEYGTYKHLIERPSGTIPLILHSEDEEFIRQVAQARRRQQMPVQHHEASESNAKSIFLGHREIEKHLQNENGLAYIWPKFELKLVSEAMAVDHLDFDEFLKEALQPKMLHLSDQEQVRLLYALNDLMGRPYWRRAWIVQEVILSNLPTIVCGWHECPLEYFSAAFGKTKAAKVKNFPLEDLQLDRLERHSVQGLVRRLSHVEPVQNYIYSFFRLWFSGTWATISEDRTTAGYGRMKGASLAKLLLWYGAQEASEASDHVLSLVGLVQQFSEDAAEVRWSRELVTYSVDYHNIFNSVAKHIVETYRPRITGNGEPSGFHILDEFFTCGPAKSGTRLPSWIPDWTLRGRDSIYLNGDAGEVDLMLPYDVQVEGRSLFISAHLVDDVWLTSAELEPENPREGPYFYGEVDIYHLLEAQPLGDIFSTPEERFEAFWRTIIADNALGVNHPDNYSPSRRFDAIRDWILLCRKNYSQLRNIWSDRLGLRYALGARCRVLRERLVKDDDLDEYFDLQKFPRDILVKILQQGADPAWDTTGSAQLGNRHFVVTKKGFFGLAPPGVQPGHVVAIIGGSRTPWYLERCGDAYTVKGPAWIHGLMYQNDKYYKGDWKNKVERIQLQ